MIGLPYVHTHQLGYQDISPTSDTFQILISLHSIHPLLFSVVKLTNLTECQFYFLEFIVTNLKSSQVIIVLIWASCPLSFK